MAWYAQCDRRFGGNGTLQTTLNSGALLANNTIKSTTLALKSTSDSLDVHQQRALAGLAILKVR
jgi:hypothetical protein